MERENEIASRVFEWSAGEKAPPYECRFNPTNKCNLACLPCVSRGKPTYDSQVELTKEEYVRLVAEAAELGVERFDICGGGEPFYVPDLIQVLEEIKNHRLKGSISTNGTMITEPTARRLVEIGWDELRFSINGYDANSDDYLRGVVGTFDRSIRTIKMIVNFKKELNKEKPNIIITPIITALNYNKIVDFFELAHKVGASTLTFQPFMPEILSGFTGTGENERRDISRKLSLDKNQRGELLSCLKEAKKLAEEYKIHANLDFLTDDSVKCNTAQLIKSDSGGKENPLLSIPCYQPWWVLDINVNGGVGPCPITQSRESVKERSLSEMWYGERFDSVRKSLANREIPTMCQTCCVISTFDNQKIRGILSDLIKGNNK